MRTLFYKSHQSMMDMEFDTLAEAIEEVHRAEQACFEYLWPLKIVDKSGNVVWDNTEICRRLGLGPQKE